MSQQWWNNDDQLLAALGEALKSGRDMPAEYIEMGKATYAWRGIHAELAILTYDSVSAGDEAELAGASRAEPANLRSLTFTSSELTLELEVTADCVLGQIVPPQPGQVQAYTADGDVASAAIDEVGGFTIRPIPRGPFRLRCHTVEGTTVVTSQLILQEPPAD
jgi:hypothetical protein